MGQMYDLGLMFYNGVGQAEIHLEPRLTGKLPLPLNPKLFLPVQWQVPVRKSKQTQMVVAVSPASPGVFPVNTTMELLHAKQG